MSTTLPCTSLSNKLFELQSIMHTTTSNILIMLIISVIFGVIYNSVLTYIGYGLVKTHNIN